MTENEIRKTIEIEASAEVVFNALTRPEELTQWFPNKAIFEPKVGGKMHFSFVKDHKMEDTEHFLDGEILELVPNRKLVYTFIPDHRYQPDGIRATPTLVTWNIEEINKNKTKVTLIHSGFTKDMEKHFKETTDGWNYFTARLVKYCNERKEQILKK